jgi:hypothetical protein
MPTQKNSASWDLQLGFNLAFKRLKNIKLYHYKEKHEKILKQISKGPLIVRGLWFFGGGFGA